MHVRLHLPHRHAEQPGDVVVALVLEVEQHDRHALVRRQFAQGELEPRLPFGDVERRVGATSKGGSPTSPSSLKKRQLAR